jgi:hypothetical protein
MLMMILCLGHLYPFSRIADSIRCWLSLTALSGNPTNINFIPVVTSTSQVIVVASIPKTALPKVFTNISERVFI